MPETPAKPTRDELLALAQMLCDGTISASDRDRLEALLRAYPDLRTDYLDYCGVNAALISRYRTGGSGNDRPMASASPSAGRFGWSPTGLTAWVTFFGLSACVLVAAGLLALRGDDTQDTAPGASHAIATVRDSSSAVWWEEKNPLNVGDRFGAGKLSLKEGSADLILDSGVRLVLEGPAELAIDSVGDAFLTSGKIAVHVPEQAIGFTLSTPTSKLIDQGTEFGVVAEEDGATEVHVFRGQVDLVYAHPDDLDASGRLPLLSHQARRVLQSNTEGQGIDFSMDRFRGLADRVNEPAEWSLAKGGNGHYYQLVFFDRSVTWQEAATDAYNRHHEGMPGHLLTVTSAEEHRFVYEKLLKGRAITNAWIGLTDVVREGFYQWITGEDFAFEHWGVDPVKQPDNFIERDGHGGEDYGTYARLPGYDWFWNDSSNDSIHQTIAVAIIEYEPPTRPVLERSITSVPITWKPEEGGNGNIYRLVLSLEPLGWEEMKRRAESTTVIGVAGRLACLETDSERQFVRENILRVCGIAVNAVGLSGGSAPDSLRWVNDKPLGDVDYQPSKFSAERVFGQFRWANLAWRLQTVPMDHASPGWFGYLIEYPLGEAEPKQAINSVAME